MLLSKREQTQIERCLVATLTEACETAKAQVSGFCWLTHVVDFACFPATLNIIWVFATEADKNRALADSQDLYMIELTAAAVQAAGIELQPVARHVHFDSEEQCLRASAGNWQQRLARQYAARG